uniref:Longin domain-containing protein n=1 Tax=Macrostomum lignano TaxID=282301 RepID=A0A1I8G4I6_9PLAT
MILLTMIARVSDGLPLAASIHNEETAPNMPEYQSKAKKLFRRLNSTSPSRCSLESGAYTFHYQIDSGVCYLALAGCNFSKRLAFSYLDDLRREFANQFDTVRVDSVARPYHFIEFEQYIKKARRSFVDSRANRNLAMLGAELQDVQRIMVENMDEVLARGESLATLDDKASHLSLLSRRYRDDAAYLNLRSVYARYGIACVALA